MIKQNGEVYYGDDEFLVDAIARAEIQAYYDDMVVYFLDRILEQELGKLNENK